MGKEIFASEFGLSVEFSNSKLPHNHKGLEMRFCSKEELFLADEIKICCKKVS